MPNGGNWKDLLRAAGKGDLSVMKYHLENGVDPCFQHPEFFTAPLFEAIRNGHLSAVQLLLGYDDKQKQLDMTEDLTDDTPMEVAFAGKQHAICNYLLTLVGNKPDYIKTVGIVGFEHDYATDLVRKVGNEGHFVQWWDNDETVEDAVVALREETGNPNLFHHTLNTRESAESPTASKEPIDVWVVNGDATASMIQAWKEQWMVSSSDKNNCRVLWCTSAAKPVIDGIPLNRLTTVDMYQSWFSWFTTSTTVDDLFWIAIHGETGKVYRGRRPLS